MHNNNNTNAMGTIVIGSVYHLKVSLAMVYGTDRAFDVA
jgi:hypothetical protein